MKNRTVRSWFDSWWYRYDGRMNAEYIVAHAKRQKSRGKQPSLGYKGEKNPKKAFKIALEELRTVNLSFGHIINHVKRNIEIAKLTRQLVLSNFNGIKFVVTPFSSPKNVVNNIQTEFWR